MLRKHCTVPSEEREKIKNTKQVLDLSVTLTLHTNILGKLHFIGRQNR